MRLLILALAIMMSSAALGAEEAPELRRHLEREGVAGVIAIYDPMRGRLRVSDAGRAVAASVPASTFKVPASLIALDLGLVRDPDADIFPFQGERFFVESCNRDQTLTSALRNSCLPVFQRLARMMGDERLSAGLKSLGFGNAAATGTFPYWLRGDMRITPLEQISFMDRLRRGAHPVSARAHSMVTEMIEIERLGDVVIRGKTGWSTAGTGVGWLAGWAEGRGETRVFAVNLEMTRMAQAPLRLKVVKAVLAAEGLID
ncbi:class D beta-lactamase [Chelativorans sp. ZYF759]|uniref:class D beta-lactamase n=1 Tax=Chelativorans sp. ZYF759 TaxID=2692213 RepID=UPI00145D2696|nr:class D beta-lactamase [Chelativorans sp. ZYF759]NMG40221.1 class D beta-lactamase [Chelativorans sp. ZYF759]